MNARFNAFRNSLRSFVQSETRFVFVFNIVRGVAFVEQPFELISDFAMSFSDSDLLARLY